MVELRHENNLAELKKHAVVEQFQQNQYVHIRAEVKNVEAVEEGKHKKLLALFEQLKKKFQSIVLRSQRDDTDIYPVMGEHLKQSVKIVHTPAFESGAVKIIAVQLFRRRKHQI
ncbi:hypothetical protein PHMEG_00025091 [Phytophthora megakarya]|uniref:Uncharacterized protein n=1 Tax=Phytophthora megakarya TaxID=4795 RepID=A0A225VCW6_9STRA|nr:hypothetical protein PHMEG_00025091 [Phytophthora megakarya]